MINLPRIVRDPTNSPYDVVLRNGDELIVPKFEQEVTVIGEVQDPTSHLYNPNLSRDDYIRLSGGFTAQADQKRVYVVRADGSVVANEGSRWFNRGSNVEIQPGDTDRGADQRRADAAAAVLGGGDGHHVQRRDRGGSSACVITAQSAP